MNTSPVISVIMPAYRCCSTICDSIESALCQDVPMELLVIDDNDDDSMAPIRERYAGDSRVVFHKSPRNMGAAASRNRGVELAKAPYVAFLDSDDIWKPGKIKKQLEILEQTGAVLCCTARELMTPEGTPTGRVLPVAPEISYKRLLRHNAISCSSVVIRTEAMRGCPMAHEDSHEDYIAWLKILREHGSARGINEPLLLYRLSNTGKSGSKLKSAKMTYTAYRYVGFSVPRSVLYFCSYAINGALKYLRA